MTNRTATFTCTNSTKLVVSPQVTLGLTPVDSATAQKATTVMTKIVNNIVEKLKNKYQTDYDRLMASKQFTVSFELPENKNKLLLNIFYNDGKNKIEFPLSDATSQSLKESLTPVAISTKASSHSTTLPTASQEELLLRTPLIRRAKPYAQRPTTPTDSLPKTSPIPPLTPAETSHNFIYRFFAALLNWIASSFSGTSDVKGSKAGQHSTAGSTAQIKTTGTEKVVASIRGLRNENNICFINAIFQALMNTSEEMINIIINAHDAKIDKEADAIERLTTEIALEESSYFLPIWSSPKRADLKILEASREASITLNQALRLYNTTKDMVWLNALRGFDPDWSGWSQQDARELLDKIFDPVLEPLTGGLGKNGLPSLDIIPENIDPNLKTSLSRFFPKFGIRKQWVLESEDSNLKNVTQLPDGIHEEVNIDPIPRFEIPNDPTTLQDVVTTGLTMQQKQLDDTAVYEINGKKGTCRIAQECLVIQSIEGNAPEYIPLQLKRFNDDLSKNETEIIMPENNRITLIVNGQDVDYEIHTLVMHEGEYLSGGHYFSYVRKNNGWVEANDSRVIPLTELPETVEKQVYMIFLKRVDREVI
jgi:hypothetical protein